MQRIRMVFQSGYSKNRNPDDKGADRALTLDTGLDHHHIKISKLINGDVRVRSNAELNDILLSVNDVLTIESCSATISNFCAQYTGRPALVIKNKQRSKTVQNSQIAAVTVDKGEFIIGNAMEHHYIQNKNGGYLEGACIDIDRIGNGSLTLKSVFIVYEGVDVEDRILCPVTISRGSTTARALSDFYHTASGFRTKIELSKEMLQGLKIQMYNPNTKYGEKDQTVREHYKFWHGSGGTFYYKICYCEEPLDRMFTRETNEVVVETAGDYANLIPLKASYGLIRVYRGEASGKYNQYVELPLFHTKCLIDDNVRINGRIWKKK